MHVEIHFEDIFYNDDFDGIVPNYVCRKANGKCSQ